MTKIKVKAEGRPDIWMVEDKESLRAWIQEKGLDLIHNFVQSSSFVIGADHQVEGVLADIDKAVRIAVFTDPKANLGHPLAIADEKLEMYDVGKITKEDLEILV